MIQHDGFLQAIDEAPEDDAPRLVYADWLEDNGDPDRAEFIRCQVRLARLPEDWETVLIAEVEARRDIPERIQAHVEEVGTPPVCRLPRYPELDVDLQKLRVAFAAMQQFADGIVNTHLPAIEADLQKFREAEPRRKARLERLAKRIEELLQEPCELLVGRRNRALRLSF